jgi:hypothetical protein
MIDVKVRWNTQCKDDRNYWRVLIDGKEHICPDVIFEIPVHTTKDLVWDSIRGQELEKHHVSCKANEVLFKDDAIIVK